uniref:Tetratricopeptide repeat protein n=1 Tax=Phenylobacterium glaciei TaxID=2803784 RepID=A0A974P496_9CAUL|nr:hypothetical protein JKL49_06720 [Phenylobacterium glaciei]
MVQPYLWTPRLPGVMLAEATSNWPAAQRDLDAAVDAAEGAGGMGRIKARVYLRPWLAYAMARSGNIEGAEAMIRQTSNTCVLCVRMSGRIADLAGNPDRAAARFAWAVRLAPSSPFANADWADMLLRRGNAAAAAEKAEAAAKAAPRWPDALQIWARALDAQERPRRPPPFARRRRCSRLSAGRSSRPS